MGTPSEQPSHLRVRPMSEAETGELLAWAQTEGWNPGRRDAALFWAADPQAFVGAELDGALIGGGAITAYGTHYGFMGLFILKPEFRGRGLGRELWYARRERLRARLAPGATIGMDGVEAMEAFYAEGGFVKSHQNRRFRFEARASAPGQDVRTTDGIPFELLADFDAAHVPARREAFLRGWLAQAEAHVRVTEQGGALTGLGVMRRCIEGHKVGPLFARDLESADAILSALQSQVPGETLFLDIPDTNPAGPELVARHGMEEVFSCARMYLGVPPVLDETRVFGITTFELG